MVFYGALRYEGNVLGRGGGLATRKIHREIREDRRGMEDRILQGGFQHHFLSC